MKRYLFVALLSLLPVLSGFGCAQKTGPTNGSTEINREDILFEAKKNGLIMNEQEVAFMMDAKNLQTVEGTNPKNVESYLTKPMEGWKSAALADVTSGGAFGLAFTSFENGTFTLIAKMGNLPEAPEGFFYEGWIVRRGQEVDVLSTGRAELVGEQSVNVFTSPTDLSDHDFYVLTLEPDDQNPAPADHILEGILK